MNKIFFLCMTIFILFLGVSSSFGQTVSEKARRHFDRGMAAVEMAKSPDDYAAAIEEFEKAAKLAPDWPGIYYNLGLVQEKAGNYSDAVMSLLRYIYLAPNASDAETVKSLINKLEYKFDLLHKEKGYSLLHAAAYNNNKEGAELLIAKGADINAWDKNGDTPLHAAAEFGHKEVAELLIAKGADINATDNIGNTPLHNAANEGQKEVPNLKYMGTAVARGWLGFRITNSSGIEFLAKKLGMASVGALILEVEEKSPAQKAGLKPNDIILAINDEWVKSANDLQMKIINLTPGNEIILTIYLNRDVQNLKIRVGEAPEAGRGQVKNTPALGREYELKPVKGQVVELLIVKGADVNARNENQLTPLHAAAIVGNKEMIELLISKGADINAKDKDGKTALHEAAIGCYREVIELLIANGADINLENNNGDTPLDVVKKIFKMDKNETHKEMINLLKEYGAK